MSNIDNKNYKRGRCLMENCDCEEYEHDNEARRPSCFYCACPPAKHVRLENEHGEIATKEVSSQETQEPAPVAINSSKGTENESANLNSKQPASQQIEKTKVVAKSNKTTEQISLKDLIPIAFSKEIEEGLAHNSLTHNQENTVIRTTCYNMLSRNRTSQADVTQITTLLLLTYPALNTSVSGNSQYALESRISKCLKNKNRPSESTRKSKEMEKNVHESCEKMKTEMERTNKKQNITLLKQYLDETRFARYKDVRDKKRGMTAKEIIMKYPALKKEDLILWEFAKLLFLDVCTIKKNWIDALDKMAVLLIKDDELEFFDSNGKAIKLLEYLPTLLKPKISTNKAILKVYEHGTDVQDTIPDKNEGPFLIGIGNTEQTDIVLMCYSDSEPIFATRAFAAVLLLLATFWIFNIAFPTELKNQFALLSIIILREKSTQALPKEFLKIAKVNTLIKEAGISFTPN